MNYIWFPDHLRLNPQVFSSPMGCIPIQIDILPALQEYIILINKQDFNKSFVIIIQGIQLIYQGYYMLYQHTNNTRLKGHNTKEF